MRKKIWGPQLALTLLWLSLPGIPSQASERVYYFHNDHLGTPQAMSDAAGRIVWTAEYDPFGKASVNQDPDGDGQFVVNNLRFPGQYYDAETGLHYNYHRDYDPSTGRYLQPDPIGLNGGLNLYSYAYANPMRFTDPNGEFVPIIVLGGIVGVMAWDYIFGAHPANAPGPSDALAQPMSPGMNLAGEVSFGLVGAVLGEAAAGTAAATCEALRMPPPSGPVPPGHGPGWQWRYPEGSSRTPRWFDPEGGEWRYHAPDPYHPMPHWDHNPWTNWNSPWQNLPIK